MKIKYKLGAAIGILVLCIIAVSIASLLTIERLGARAVHMYDGPLMSISFAQSGHTNFMKSINIFSEAIKDPSEDIIEDLEWSQEDFIGDLEIVIERSELEESRNQATALLTKGEAWLEVAVALIEDEASDTSELEELSEEIEESLDALVEAEAEAGYFARESAEELVQYARVFNIALAVVGTVLGLIVAGSLGYRITSGIRNLSASMIKVSEGELDIEISNKDGRDEIGIMARGLDGFRENAATQVAVLTALQSSDSPTLVLDTNGKTIFANAAFQAFLEKVGPNVSELCCVDEETGQSDYSGLIERLSQESTTEEEEKIKFSSGKVELRRQDVVITVKCAQINDKTGDYAGVALEFEDVTSQQALADEVIEVISNAKAGMFDKRTSVGGGVGFLEEFAGGLNELLETVSDFIQKLDNSISAMAEGDLTCEIEGNFGGDIQHAVERFNQGLERLRSALIGVEDLTGQVHEEMEPIKSGASVLSERASEQLQLLEKSADSMQSISSSITEVASTTSELTKTSLDTANNASDTCKAISSAVDAMSKIEKSSVRVSEIIGVIDGIAFQTNLLALNAAVEAARAGDAGRGFEVVASEVRSLATRSSDAANEVRGIIDEISKEITEGVSLANNSSELITDIDEKIRSLAESLSEASTIQANLSKRVVDSNADIASVKNLTDLNSRLADQNATSASALQSTEEALISQIKKFKTRKQSGYDNVIEDIASTG